MELPDYIDFFAVSYSPEFVENIVSIETSFHSVNYTKHLDLINAVFQLEGTKSIRDLCDDAIAIYRTHIYDCLHMQGFTLNNADEDKLYIIAKILHGVTVLATRPIKDVTEGVMLDEGEDDVSYVCGFLNICTGLDVVLLIQYISSVDEHVVDLLRAGENIDDFRSVNLEKSQQRFIKVMGERKEGIVVNAIRSLGYFGYDYDVLLKLVEDDIEVLKDPVEIRRELLLLAAGSSIKLPSVMLMKLEETVEHLFTNPNLMLSINARWPDMADLEI